MNCFVAASQAGNQRAYYVDPSIHHTQDTALEQFVAARGRKEENRRRAAIECPTLCALCLVVNIFNDKAKTVLPDRGLKMRRMIHDLLVMSDQQANVVHAIDPNSVEPLYPLLNRDFQYYAEMQHYIGARLVFHQPSGVWSFCLYDITKLLSPSDRDRHERFSSQPLTKKRYHGGCYRDYAVLDRSDTHLMLEDV